MQYLATLGGCSGIENKVIHTNFILEAFGNAKTSKNDNSSRFGKLTEIQFNDGGKICGAKIQTFLLEKTRVVQREKGERSYHVFYQLCAGASHILKEKLNLKAADEYEYLKQSDSLRISCVDDSQRFHMLMEALNIAHISKEDQENAFTMLAAVLWIGNIEFQVINAENHVEVVTSEGVTSAAKLMGCEVSELMLALSTRKFHADKDSIVEKLTLSQAIDTRNALAMSIYVFLFDWLVQQINKSIEVGETHTCRSITILDIYGFESFHRNSFEQFCINYANERLQQHFNRHMFKLEQEEYVQDGIDWTTVEFIDNSECLDLFEKRPLGLLSLLDEESSFSEATDLTFINKLKQHLNGNPCFKGEGGGAFRVRHYAGEVLYDTSGFLEKNRDLLHSDSVKLLAHCQLSGLFATYILNRYQDTNLIRQFTSADLLDQSVGSKFKDQLFKLMQCLESTTPHFIRCIKPNSNQLPGMFENEHVLQQLRCCGVLEIVKISKAGYPFRIAHQRFAERYGFLIFENVASEDPLSIAVAVLQKFNVLPEMYQVGYTKLFFRTAQISALENARNHTIQGILRIQKYFRGLKSRGKFQELKKGATTLQSFIRGSLVRRNFLAMRTIGAKKYHKKVDKEVDKNLRGGKDTKTNHKKDHPQVQSSVSTELEVQVLKAEATQRQREEENNKLREQLREYERRYQENEAKMKSMEEAWKMQMAALTQLGLDAAKKSEQSEVLNSSVHLNYDSDVATSGMHTPDSTPSRAGYMSHGTPIRGPGNPQDAVGSLVKEYEQRKQAFENDVRLLVEMKSGSSTNRDEELRRLKAQFESWKKDYKVRLKDAKAALQKLGVSDGDKSWRKWWIVKGVRL